MTRPALGPISPAPQAPPLGTFVAYLNGGSMSGGPYGTTLIDIGSTITYTLVSGFWYAFCGQISLQSATTATGSCYLELGSGSSGILGLTYWSGVFPWVLDLSSGARTICTIWAPFRTGQAGAPSAGAAQTAHLRTQQVTITNGTLTTGTFAATWYGVVCLGPGYGTGTIST